MKITLKDFGPISHFEFDLDKDLHMIFGKNNIGKSYAITAVYLILKNLINISDRKEHNEYLPYFMRHYVRLGDEDLFNLITNYEFEITDKLKNNEEFDITAYIKSIFIMVVNQDFLRNLENSFKNSFTSIEQLANKFSKNRLTILLEYNFFNIIIETEKNNLVIKELYINYSIIAKKSSINTKQQLIEGKYYLFFGGKDDRNVSNYLRNLYSGFISEVSSLISSVYFLPASRSGLYQGLNGLSPIIAELSKSRNLLTQKIELPSISEPIADYFLNLSTIDNKEKNEFSEIIETIEKDILKGQIVFNNETKKIIFKQGILEFDLSFTSSMVSEIAPIVAYLKYIINTNGDSGNEKYGLLFIEEPEAHLHPEVQVKLMEMFALLAGKNVKIVMTSHSNYMFNKLSNLILEGKIDYNKVGSYLMKATDKGSVTDTLSMKAEAEGMNDENFADVAEMLYEERIKIYDKLNKAEENVD